jgi:four helix bundle protein
MDSVPLQSSKPFPEVLQERLLNFAAGVCDQARRIQHDLVSASMVQQLVRAASSVAANYAEARAAQSRRDFIHKMQICLKELRETQVWLELVRRTTEPGIGAGLARECGELTAIVVASINTARRRQGRESPIQPA